MQLLAHSASERLEDSRTLKRPISRANRRTDIDQKCSFKATSVCTALAGNLQFLWAKCSWLELRLSLAWRRGRGDVSRPAPHGWARSLGRCRDGSRSRDGSQSRDLPLLQPPPPRPQQGQLQAGPQDAALAALHRALVSALPLELCWPCREGLACAPHLRSAPDAFA